jgi:hypothetical protein
MSENGISNVATQAEELGKVKWKKKKRPKGWRGNVYGLIVHTTGGSLPSRAKKGGMVASQVAVDYYLKSHGTHYVCGWGGELIQVANEDQQANGASTTEQRESEDWEADLPAATVRRWHERWDLEGADGPLDLFPTKYANSCYVHVEMPPCVFHHNGKLTTEEEPMGKGLRFTKLQHDKIAELAVDVADRNGWPDFWWESGRFVGHEDVSPITRHDRNGGWDPGALRAQPRFDWEYVYAKIEELCGLVGDDEEQEESLVVPEVAAPVKKETLDKMARSFIVWVRRLLGIV